jgi:Ca2+-binding RTX toxin-like protein
MPSVTVAGANNQIVTLNFDSQSNAALANQLASVLTTGIQNGSILPAVDTDGPPPPLPPGKTGEFVQTLNGTIKLPAGYNAYVDTAPKAIVFGSGGDNESILADSSSNLDFIATGGSGTIVGGDSRIFIPVTDNGDWSINTGNGSNQVFALGGGNDTITTGTGNNHLVLGSGNDLIQTSGNSIITASNGSETVSAFGGQDLIDGNASDLFFISQNASATIFGGSGSDTFFGGSGPDYVQGGTGGKNLLIGGSGAATLIGGGDGDQLFAGDGPGQLLKAGSGNETLVGGFGSDTFQGGGSGSSSQIFGGMGNDTFVSAGGIATVTAGASSNLFAFVRSNPGGSEVINGFISGVDQIGLEGFKGNEVAHALKSQKVVDGNDTITLSDHTKITFVGVTSLSESDFTTINGKHDFVAKS